MAGNKTLVAVTAAQPVGGATTLDPGSAVDLTGSVRSDGLVHWSVPAGRWLLFGFWRRPSGQLPNSLYGLSQDANLDAVVPDTDPSRLLTVDPYNPDATTAALGWLDQNMMTPDAVNLFREDGGELYEDSLEYYYGTHSTPWTPKLLDAFRARRGYSLERYLPALFIPDLYTFWKSGATIYSKPDFDFAGGLGVRVRHDYYATLTDLFIEHQQLLQGWAQRYGLTGFRHQDYGTTIDSSRAQRATGIPDTESLAAGEPWPAGSPGEQQALDSYRVAAGAAHIAGAPAVDMETGDVQGCDKGFCPYGEQPTDYWRIINRAYSAGVTRIQIHGMAYRHVPPTEQGIQPNPWPGWNPWVGIFSEPWADTWPQWKFWLPFTTYMGRASQILSQGRPGVDLLFYRDNFLGTAAGDLGNTRRLSLDEAGYTYDFTDPVTLATEGTRRRWPAVPGRRGLQGADHRRRRQLGVRDAGTDRRQARGARARGSTDRVRRRPTHAGNERARPSRRGRDGAPVGCGRAGAAQRTTRRQLRRGARRPRGPRDQTRCGLEPPGCSIIRAVHRRTATRDYWYLFNDAAAPVRFTASLATRGTPYQVDLWDNTTTPVTQYHQAGSSLQVPLRLGPQQATVLVVDRARNAPLHVVSTTADSASASGGRLTVADSRAGTYRTALSDGKTRAVRVGGSPGPLTLSRWQLHVEEFAPSSSPTHDLALTRLMDWQQIPALEVAAGTGTYRARYTVPGCVDPTTGAGCTSRSERCTARAALASTEGASPPRRSACRATATRSARCCTRART